MPLAGFKRPAQGFGGHPAQHQNPVAGGVGGDAGNEPVRVEFRVQFGPCFDLFHRKTGVKWDCGHVLILLQI